MILCVVIAAAAVFLDQITKFLVVQNISEGASVEGIRGVFRLTYIENKGAAFGILSEHRWVFMILSVIAIAAILFYLWREKPESILARLSLGMILGGGIGNMIDRVLRGAVIDFVDVELIRFPYIFNVADAFVCVGCVLLILYLILSEVQSKKKKQADDAKDAPADSEADT